jgi:UDP-N-acetylmuramyl tripeptide synthase
MAQAAKTRINSAIERARLTAAIGAARTISFGLRRSGRGGGTATPGLVAHALDPKLLSKLASGLPHGAIVIAGTNGKTTVSRMVAGILAASGDAVVHNRSGSNLVRGVTAAFAEQARLTGKLQGDVAVIETDEAAFPEIVRLVQPRAILLNNLFRDQLDRYGELAAVAKLWSGALARLSPETTVIVNADDPTLAEITSDIPARRITFGIAQSDHKLAALPHAADSAVCLRCGSDLVYAALYASHLGDWRCPACGAERPALDVSARDIKLHGVDSVSLSVTSANEPDLQLAANAPGLYNAYNVLAAAAAARAMGVNDAVIASAIAQFKPAFGRGEQIELRGRRLTLALVKNPVGFNEVLRMLTMATGGLTVPTLIAINDLYADGRDVSWLWDVDFELLADGEAPLSTTGLRGADMANRLKYAGTPPDRITPLGEDLPAALDLFVDSIPHGGTGCILPTYTALLELRSALAARGSVGQFWEQ